MSLKYNFDCLFFARFQSMFKRFLFNKGSILLLFTFLLFLSLLEQVAVYQVGMVTSAYYKIMTEKDMKAFWTQTTKSVLLISGIALVKSVKDYVASTLYVEWRHNLTRKLHELYFTDNFYYKVNVTDAGNDRIDNPDQRMTQDVDKMCQDLSKVIPDIITAPFVIGYYSYHSFKTTGIVGPTGCFVFFLLTTIVNKLLMSPIVNLIYNQEKAEGVFRYHHLHVRTNSESIAFMNGATVERGIADQKLTKLINVQESLILWKFPLMLSVNFTDYFGSIVSFMVLAVPLYAGKYDNLTPSDLSQLISQNGFVSIYLINSFTRLVDLSTQFVTIAGTTHRICQLIESLEFKRSEEGLKDGMQSGTNCVPTELCSRDCDTYYDISKLCVAIPNGKKTITYNFDLKIKKGINVLIRGSSGCGKTTIFRALKGLWEFKAGSMECRIGQSEVESSKVMFLPQRPLLTSGSLKQQIIYPQQAADCPIFYEAMEEQIRNHLEFLQLSHLIGRVDCDLDKDVEWSWYDVLSPGEMQRLAIARVLFHRPHVVFLDEATSALSVDMESKIYEKLSSIGVTVVTAGHRDSLAKHHQHFIDVDDHHSS